MKVGVIGGGSMGENHIRIYNEMKDVEFVGICDADRNRAISLAKSYNAAPYFDHKELLKHELDAVCVVVPKTPHYKVAMDVFDPGTHLMVEKPIADTLENADKMIQAAYDANVKLTVGHIERH